MSGRLRGVFQVGVLLAAVAMTVWSGETQMTYGDPRDWAEWERFRGTVTHPCTLMQAADLARARENIRRHEWAATYAKRVAEDGAAIAAAVTPEYVERMAEITTPGCTGPCPACRAQGLPWHPNGQWSWSAARPEQLTCNACKTVFPHEDYPETVVVRSTWDPRQQFSFIGGDTFRCFGYRYARPSLSGIIRARKLAYLTGQLDTLATAHALDGDPVTASACRLIFLRLAEVLPRYLVRAGYGYGEYADCDPHTAAERINNLPNDELVYPPNKPDRKIHTGYWSASRIGSSGMDGWWVSRVAQAYDLTCEARHADGTPVFAAEERVRIEQDVLLESAYLAACDSAINNKSVGNRAGAAMVGLAVGHPSLTRFGLEGFVRTVEEWFLPDGGTSESAAYAMMTMSGIRPFAPAFRDYSEPDGYTPPAGDRLVGFNACRDTLYGDCWQGLLQTLQGDLRHPPLADSYRTTAIGSTDAELLALCFPTDAHKALLRETAGSAPSGGAAKAAIFYRNPDAGDDRAGRLALPDTVFPFLAQGFLRGGPDGRDSVAVLDASDWGNHHHSDGLNLYLWQEKHELLSDLGYLWDHPDKHMTARTFAHNTVLIDGREQRSKGRGGEFRLFAAFPRIKMMEAESDAYEDADVYGRTVLRVDHGAEGSYTVDVFRVAGGRRHDYVFHGPTTEMTASGIELSADADLERPVRFAVRFHLDRVGELDIRDARLERPDRDGNPAAEGGEGFPGWGAYIGNGRAESETADGPDGGAGVRFRAVEGDAEGNVNVALILGDSDGYRGSNAVLGKTGDRYRLSFRARGSGVPVRLNVVRWPGDPNSPGDRTYSEIDDPGAARFTPGDEWQEVEVSFSLPAAVYDLENVRGGNAAAGWALRWGFPDGYRFAAHAPGDAGEAVLVGDGWGQRDHRNSDRGAQLPYVIRRREGGGSRFVSVFEGYSGEPLVQRVEYLPGTSGDASLLAVHTRLGTDLIAVRDQGGTTIRPTLGDVGFETDARIAVLAASGGTRRFAALAEGTVLRADGIVLHADQPEYAGTVRATESPAGASAFIAEGKVPDPAELPGTVVLLTGGDGRERAYPVRAAEAEGGNLRIFTKAGHSGYEARPAQRWRLPVTAYAEQE